MALHRPLTASPASVRGDPTRSGGGGARCPSETPNERFFEAFYVGVLVARLGKSSTIRRWERQGVLPPTPHEQPMRRGPAWPLYPPLWIEGVVATIAEDEGLVGRRPAGMKNTHFTAQVRELHHPAVRLTRAASRARPPSGDASTSAGCLGRHTCRSSGSRPPRRPRLRGGRRPSARGRRRRRVATLHHQMERPFRAFRALSRRASCNLNLRSHSPCTGRDSSLAP